MVLFSPTSMISSSTQEKTCQLIPEFKHSCNAKRYQCIECFSFHLQPNSPSPNCHILDLPPPINSIIGIVISHSFSEILSFDIHRTSLLILIACFETWFRGFLHSLACHRATGQRPQPPSATGADWATAARGIPSRPFGIWRPIW